MAKEGGDGARYVEKDYQDYLNTARDSLSRPRPKAPPMAKAGMPAVALGWLPPMPLRPLGRPTLRPSFLVQGAFRPSHGVQADPLPRPGFSAEAAVSIPPVAARGPMPLSIAGQAAKRARVQLPLDEDVERDAALNEWKNLLLLFGTTCVYAYDRALGLGSHT